MHSRGDRWQVTWTKGIRGAARGLLTNQVGWQLQEEGLHVTDVQVYVRVACRFNAHENARVGTRRLLACTRDCNMVLTCNAGAKGEASNGLACLTVGDGGLQGWPGRCRRPRVRMNLAIVAGSLCGL